MVFANEEHEKFYYEKLEQARYQDCCHKALIYIFGISEDTRNHFSQIYDMKSGYIKTDFNVQTFGFKPYHSLLKQNKKVTKLLK